MKKFFYLLSTGIVAALVVSSCSTSNDVVSNGMFQKRKYNKGYHVSRTGKNHTDNTDQKENLAVRENTENTVSELPARRLAATVTSEKTYNTVPMSVSTKATDAQPTEVITPASNNTVRAFSAEEQTTTETAAAEKAHNQAHAQTITPKKEQQKSSESGSAIINLVLLIILAILLPPLAVGIATDWAIGPLLLSIVLTLLFFLPGVIYALIVVLNA